MQNINFLLVELFALCGMFFTLNMFTTNINERSTITAFIKKSIYTRKYNELPYGIIICLNFNNPFLAYANVPKECPNQISPSHTYITVLCTEKTWEIINAADKVKEFDTKIMEYQEQSSYFGDIRTVLMKTIKPWTHQQKIINEIKAIYEINKFATVLIEGDTGTGKSAIAYILAQQYKTVITKKLVYDVEHASSSFTKCVNPSFNSPGIVLFDELDEIVNFDSQSSIKIENKKLICKKQWNSFMDNINSGLYPFIIWIFTTNKKREQIENSDNSVFRGGRINLHVITSNKESRGVSVTIKRQYPPSFI